MLRFFLYALALSISASLFAQQSSNQTWYYGKFGGIKFTNAIPLPITGKLDTWEGCAVYCDPNTGNVLLYSDGKKLFLPDGSKVAFHRPNVAFLFLTLQTQKECTSLLHRI